MDRMISADIEKLGLPSGGTEAFKRRSTKTDAGARMIPLNRDAVLALSEFMDRLAKLKVDKPEPFLFPACENGHIDPTKPKKGWRTAWRSLTKTAGLRGLRFHDLRHHCITELAELGLSDQTIMSLAGYVGREMLDHSSHIRLEAERRVLAGVYCGPAQSENADVDFKGLNSWAAVLPIIIG